MPHENITKYVTGLGSNGRLFVLLHTRSRKGKRAEVFRFCLEYRAHVEGRWRKVVRYDNSHGIPHRHAFGWYGEIGEPTVLGRFEDSARIFNENRDRILKEYGGLKERFLLSK